MSVQEPPRIEAKESGLSSFAGVSPRSQLLGADQRERRYKHGQHNSHRHSHDLKGWRVFALASAERAPGSVEVGRNVERLGLRRRAASPEGGDHHPDHGTAQRAQENH